MNKNFWIYFIVIFFLLHAILYRITHTKVIVEFEDLEPFAHSIPVYYKGFKLGKTGKIHPGKNFDTTYVDIYIKSNELIFPVNTTAIVRRKDRKDYIELIYPNTPYITKLQNNSIIKGKKGINFENFLQDENRNGSLDILTNNLNETIGNANTTLETLNMMLQTLTDILQISKPAISDTINNIDIASKNFANTTGELNSALNREDINDILHNFNMATENLSIATQNISEITGNINNNSVNLFNCMIKDITTVVNNINSLVSGVVKTLKKRFSGIRIMFGKGLDD